MIKIIGIFIRFLSEFKVNDKCFRGNLKVFNIKVNNMKTTKKTINIEVIKKEIELKKKEGLGLVTYYVREPYIFPTGDKLPYDGKPKELSVLKSNIERIEDLNDSNLIEVNIKYCAYREGVIKATDCVLDVGYKKVFIERRFEELNCLFIEVKVNLSKEGFNNRKALRNRIRENPLFYLDMGYERGPNLAKKVTLELKLYRKSKRWNHFFENTYLKDYQRFVKPLREEARSDKDYFMNSFSEFLQPPVRVLNNSLNGLNKYEDNCENNLINKDKSLISIVNSSIYLNDVKYSANNIMVYHLISEHIQFLFPNGRIYKSFVDKNDFFVYMSRNYITIKKIRFFIKRDVGLKLVLYR